MTHDSSLGRNLFLILAILFTISFGIGTAWINICRSDLDFKITQSLQKLKERTILQHKLEIERARLLAPIDLRRKAEALGMIEAQPGQIRRLPAPSTVSEVK